MKICWGSVAAAGGIDDGLEIGVVFMTDGQDGDRKELDQTISMSPFFARL